MTALTAATFVSTNLRIDPDLWGHVRFGLDALRDRRLTEVDPYSFTQDVPWINHEWLSEVVQALAYRALGVPGLIALKTALLAAAFGLIAMALRHVDERYRWWLLAAGIAGTAPAAFTARPQLWTLVAVPALWWALGDRRFLPLVPLLFLLWANVHGGWIVGVGIATLFVAGHAIDARGVRATVPQVVAIVVALAATLINPYGFRLWAFLVSTVRLTRQIGEWQPIWKQADVSSAVLWILIVAVVVSTAIHRRRTLKWREILPVLWLAAMSVFVMRLVPVFSEVAVLAAAAAWQPRAPGVVSTSTPSRPAPFVLVDIGVAAAVVLANLAGPGRCVSITGAWAPDLETAGALASPAVQGRLVLPFDWGEYAIWHFAPRLRVSIDGRRETVYSETTLERSSALTAGRPEGLDYLRTLRPEYVWLRDDVRRRQTPWFDANDYRVDVASRRAFVAVRRDLPRLEPGRPASGCFP